MPDSVTFARSPVIVSSGSTVKWPSSPWTITYAALGGSQISSGCGTVYSWLSAMRNVTEIPLASADSICCLFMGTWLPTATPTASDFLRADSRVTRGCRKRFVRWHKGHARSSRPSGGGRMISVHSEERDRPHEEFKSRTHTATMMVIFILRQLLGGCNAQAEFGGNIVI